MVPRRALVVPTALLLLLLATGACGGEPADEPDGARDDRRINLASVDVCRLLDDVDLRDFFNEPVGQRKPTVEPDLKTCTIDDASVGSYVFLSLQQSPAGAGQQFAYNKGAAKDPKPVGDLGEDAFSHAGADEAHVEVLYGDVVLGVALMLYATGERITDPPATVSGLTALAKRALTRL